MNEEKGYASKLLSQIRFTLEKKGINLENLSMKKCKSNTLQIYINSFLIYLFF